MKFVEAKIKNNTTKSDNGHGSYKNVQLSLHGNHTPEQSHWSFTTYFTSGKLHNSAANYKL